MTRRRVPHDEPAERAVVGTVLLNPFAAGAAATLIRPEDFYSPAHGRLFAVGLDLAEEQCGLSAAERVATGWDRDFRMWEAAARVAARVADPVDLVGELMAEAPVLWGVEPYARRVAAAARAREVMAAAVDVYTRLAEGADVDDVLPRLVAVEH